MLTVSLKSHKRSQQGFALVFVVASLAILTMLVLSFSNSARLHVRATANVISAARAEALANAGVYLALSDILQTKPQYELGLIACSSHTGDSLTVDIQNASGRIDLNTASDELLSTLLLSLGLPSDVAWAQVDRIVDFRDEDDLPRANGAERQEYLVAGRPNGPKNMPFEAISELEQVLDVDEAWLSRVREYLTVHSTRRGIDPHSADPELIRILQSQIGSPILPEHFIARGKSQAYHIRSTAISSEGGVFVRDAVVKFEDLRYRFVEWERGSQYYSDHVENVVQIVPCRI